MTGLTIAALLLAAEAPPAPLVFTDQWERPCDVGDYKGHVVVLIYGDRKSADANKELGGAVHVHFHPMAKGQPPAQARQAPVTPLDGVPPGGPSPDVCVLPVASIGKVPNLVQGVIRGQFKKGSPEVPVLLDFENVMKERFGLKPGVPNVVVVDAKGVARYIVSGDLTPEQLGSLVAAVEGLRREAVPRTRE